MFPSTDNVFSYYKAIIVSGLGLKNPKVSNIRFFGQSLAKNMEKIA